MLFKIILFALSMTLSSCAELGTGVCANFATASTTSTTTPHAPSGAAVAGALINCAEPAVQQLETSLLGTVVQKLEGGAANFISDLTALEGDAPAGVACLSQDLLQASCAPATSPAPAPAATAVASSAAAPTALTSPASTFASVPHLAETDAAPAAESPPRPKLPRLSAAATARAQKYLKARGFRFQSRS